MQNTGSGHAEDEDTMVLARVNWHNPPPESQHRSHYRLGLRADYAHSLDLAEHKERRHHRDRTGNDQCGKTIRSTGAFGI